MRFLGHWVPRRKVCGSFSMRCPRNISALVDSRRRCGGAESQLLERPVLEEIVDKLPVLFVSCNSQSLDSRQKAGSGPARMVWGKSVRSVLLISIDTSLQAPLVIHLNGDLARSKRIFGLLSNGGFSAEIQIRNSAGRESLLRLLLSEKPESFSELCLNIGMSDAEYRVIGQCLETMRKQGTLIICLDDRLGNKVSPHDRHLREIINGWVQGQQWCAAMSFKGGGGTTQNKRVDEPTICLLKAAFFLGGSQSPQRMFSTGMNKVEQTLWGFSWMN